jgi:hypothetical protein
MLSECIGCDRPAVRYWGQVAFCKACLGSAKMTDPEAHRCIRCGKEQPGNVSWFRTSPCRECHEKDR